MKRTISLLLASLFATTAMAVEPPSQKINSAQARALVVAALNTEQKRLPGLGAEQFDGPKSSRFLFFTVTWPGTPNGSVVVGNYAVDPYTGDVGAPSLVVMKKRAKNFRPYRTKYGQLSIFHSRNTRN